jgi:pimeloyl-ACP methyl ester carboxylesterase
MCAVPGVGERYLAYRRRVQSPEASVRRVLAACCVDQYRVAPDLVDAHVALTARMDRAAADGAYLSSARSLARSLLRPMACQRALDRIRVPVLLLHGDADRLVPLSTSQRLRAARPEWRLAVARGVGHVPMMEAPEWTVRRIAEWLATTGLLPPTSPPAP